MSEAVPPSSVRNPMGWTLAGSHYHAQFESQILAVTLATEVFANVDGFLQSFFDVRELNTYSHLAPVRDFAERLRKEAADAGIDIMGDAGPTAELLWSSAQRVEGVKGYEKELCGLINQALREDPPKLAWRLAAVVRAINAVRDVRSREPSGQLPAGAAVEVRGLTGSPQHNRMLGRVQSFIAEKRRYDVKLDEDGHHLAPKPSNVVDILSANRFPPGGMTYRGGGFDSQHRGFFAVGETYRVTACQGFWRRHSIEPSLGGERTLWVVHVDPAGDADESRRCKHAYLIQSHLRHEAEFLFTAFSVFTVRSVEWGEGGAPSRVDLDAAMDNDGWPLDLPLAPWY